MIEGPATFTRMPEVDPSPNLFNNASAPKDKPFNEHLEALLDRAS
jgi:hypothetical protein